MNLGYFQEIYFKTENLKQNFMMEPNLLIVGHI